MNDGKGIAMRCGGHDAVANSLLLGLSLSCNFFFSFSSMNYRTKEDFFIGKLLTRNEKCQENTVILDAISNASEIKTHTTDALLMA